MKAPRRERPAALPVQDAPPLPHAGARRGRQRDEVDLARWRAWMREFGGRVRRAREALGLSQQQLGAVAGVSQGAISRLEAGHGLATPLVIVLKLQQALAARLRAQDPGTLDDALRASLDLHLLAPLTHDMPVATDAVTEQIVRLYHGTPARSREHLLSILRVAADGLRSGS